MARTELARVNGRWFATIERAAAMLAEAKTIDEILHVANLAQRAADFARAAGLGLQASNAAKKIELDARRKTGETLRAMKDRGELARPGDAMYQRGTSVTLDDLGLNRNDSARYQRESLVPEEIYATWVQNRIEAAEELTSAGLRKLAKREAQTEEEETRAATAAKRNGHVSCITADTKTIRCHALITDPPYGILNQAWEPADLQKFTRHWASAWDNCGADLIAVFWSQRYLWDGRSWLDESLPDYEFQQLLVWCYANNKSPQNRLGFKQTWEPIFLYRRNGSGKEIRPNGNRWGGDATDFDHHVAAVPQENFDGAERKEHPAQKPVSVMRWLVGALTRAGELVADPFCGSGTTGIAALQLGRRFHGIEIDPQYRAMAKRRIGAYGTAGV